MLREMIESGVIRYGEEFKKGMEEGHWDLSKVDYDEVAKSQVSDVYKRQARQCNTFHFPVEEFLLR